MKKYFILAAVAIVAFASCTKHELETKPTEISYNAVTAKNNVTKAIINSTTYATTDPSFGIWGLYQATSWASNHEDDVWIGTSASAATEITYALDADNTANSNAWRNASSVDYWPLTGSLVFMGYSPYTGVSAAIAVDNSNYVNLTVSGFQTANGNWVADLMWSDAVERSSNTEPYSIAPVYTGVPVVFHHALSQIAVYAKTDKDYAGQDYTFTITDLSITVDDNANLTVKDNLSADPTVSWTEPATDATRTILASADSVLNNSSFKLMGEAFLVIPQTLTTDDVLSVTYQVEHNSVVSTVTKTIKLNYGETDTTNHDDRNELTSFAANTKYNLNLVFSMDEIKYSPSIVDWETPAVEAEYEVPHDAN